MKHRSKTMKNVISVILVAAALMGIISCGSDKETVREINPDNPKLYSAAALEEDFRQFRRIMEEKTAGLYTDRAELTRLLDEAETSIQKKSMAELEFYRLLAPIVAELRCGHSFLSVSESMEAYMRDHALFFPLEVRIFDNSLFVIDDPHGTGVTPGSEIVRINGTSAGEVISIIRANMVTDGYDRGRPRYDTERWFAAMYYSFIDTADEFELVVQSPDGEGSTEVSVPAVRDSSLAKTTKGVMHDTKDSPYSVSIENGYALMTVSTFNYSKPKQFKAFLEDSFTELAEKEVDTLILDLRGNYGGTPVPTVELFAYLIEGPVPFFAKDNPFYLNKWKKPVEPAPQAFNGRLYVLMDEAGFSMNSFLLSLLEYHRIGTLIGTPSSGGYMCSDASREKTLKNTGLRLRYSTQAFKTAVEGQKAGIGIEPDIFVEWSLEDYLSGNDPVLAAAVEASAS